MNTHTSNLKTLPFIDARNNKTYKLLLVAPRARATETEGGIVISQDAGDDCEVGVIVATGNESEFSPGDEVVYRRIDRSNPDAYETYEVDGKQYDIIGENEVWSANDVPYNRVFIEPLSDLHLSESALAIPEDVQGITEKGRVMFAPPFFTCKEGDIIEYRKNTKGIYYTANIDGILCDVIYEPDIFTINGEVSPHRIIVKVDIGLQTIKRQTTDMGLQLSPLFAGMLRNLQYAKVTAIGAEASKIYPELRRGDMVIMHHSIESQPHRILKTKKGKHGGILYEYRMIEAYNPKARELFGTIRDKKIIPFGDSVFFEWNFDVFEQPEDMTSYSIDLDFSIHKCRNLDDLKMEIAKRTKEGADRYKQKANGYKADQELCDMNVIYDREKFELINTKMEQLRREAGIYAAYIKRNHMLKLKVAYPQKERGNYALATFMELYPINVLGKKYLIGHRDYVYAFVS